MRPIDADALLVELPVHPDGGLRTVAEECLMIRVRETVKEAPTVAKDIKVPDKWVSVKDRLPEKSGVYLCWFGANKVAIGPAIVTYVDKWKAFGRLDTLEKYPNITHWMPLPEPPKEG